MQFKAKQAIFKQQFLLALHNLNPENSKRNIYIYTNIFLDMKPHSHTKLAKQNENKDIRNKTKHSTNRQMCSTKFKTNEIKHTDNQEPNSFFFFNIEN